MPPKRKNTGSDMNPRKKSKTLETRVSSNKNKLSTDSTRCLTSEDQNYDLTGWVSDKTPVFSHFFVNF